MRERGPGIWVSGAADEAEFAGCLNGSAITSPWLPLAAGGVGGGGGTRARRGRLGKGKGLPRQPDVQGAGEA